MGPHTELLKSNIERMRLKNISLKGFHDDVKSIWQQNHLLFMPSRLEGQSLALTEGMYFGRTAVVTDVGGATELITDEINGFIADAVTVNSIDNALERAWLKRDQWEKMGARAHKIIIQKYSVPEEVFFNGQIQLLLQAKTEKNKLRYSA
jgi:glycosyltransferase involved in cell wall biosynthesis